MVALEEGSCGPECIILGCWSTRGILLHVLAIIELTQIVVMCCTILDALPVSFNPPNNPTRQELLLMTVLQMSRLKTRLTEVTQIASGRARTQMQGVWLLQSNSIHTFDLRVTLVSTLFCGRLQTPHGPWSCGRGGSYTTLSLSSCVASVM